MAGLSERDVKLWEVLGDDIGDVAAAMAMAALHVAWENPEWFAYWAPRIAENPYSGSRPDAPYPEVEAFFMKMLPCEAR